MACSYNPERRTSCTTPNTSGVACSYLCGAAESDVAASGGKAPSAAALSTPRTRKVGPDMGPTKLTDGEIMVWRRTFAGLADEACKARQFVAFLLAGYPKAD